MNNFADVGFQENLPPNPKRAFFRGAAEGLGTFGDIYQGSREALEQRMQPVTGPKVAGAIGRGIGGIFNAPTSQNINDLLNYLGIQKQEGSPEEKYAGRIGRYATPAALTGGLAALPSALLAATGEQGAEMAGFGPTGQTIAGIIAGGYPAVKEAFLKAKETPNLLMKSGITKRKVVGQPEQVVSKAVISPERQAESIAKLNQEAAKIVKSKVHKHVPLLKALEEGVDFESINRKNMDAVHQMAKSSNTVIDIDPLSDFLTETAGRYKKIRKLSPELKEIQSEVKAFKNNPASMLEDLVEIYRDNNKKYRKVVGKDPEYAHFLSEYNRKIVQSIEETLPKDNEFVNFFKTTNKDYRDYKNAQFIKRNLDSMMQGNPTIEDIKNISINQAKQKALIEKMGKEGANDIIDIAKDMTIAHEALKSIPVKSLKIFDSIYPIADLLPLGSGISLKGLMKVTPKLSKRVLGYNLSSPEKKDAYKNALNALKTGDKSAYIRATHILSGSEEPAKNFEELGFTEEQIAPEQFENLGFSLE